MKRTAAMTGSLADCGQDNQSPQSHKRNGAAEQNTKSPG